MKKCFKCSEVLPLSEFYKHPMMGDGHLGKCKRCTRLDVRRNYATRREQYREYDRTRYRMSEDRRMALKASEKKYPLKAWARAATISAINRGVLVRMPCEVCGAEADAHHVNYREPLNVKWLCRAHHMAEHSVEGRLEDVG